MTLTEELGQKFSLTSREVGVVEQIAKGISNKEAASNLYVCEKTVKFHLTNIYKKMELREEAIGYNNKMNRTKLILWVAKFRGENRILS